MKTSFNILYEDNHLLIVDKPAMLPTMGVAEDQPSLISEAKQYIKEAYQKPGNVYLGIVSRLDARVTGVIAIARTSKAARRLTEQYRLGTVTKKYWALVEQTPDPPSGQLQHWMRKDERHRKMHTCQPDDDGAKEARLSYRTLHEYDAATLLEVELDTGRKHQIRVQFSKSGYPLIGDRKYGSKIPFGNGIALHSRTLTLAHPTRQESMTFEAPCPPEWDGYMGRRG